MEEKKEVKITEDQLRTSDGRFATQGQVKVDLLGHKPEDVMNRIVEVAQKVAAELGLDEDKVINDMVRDLRITDGDSKVGNIKSKKELSLKTKELFHQLIGKFRGDNRDAAIKRHLDRFMSRTSDDIANSIIDRVKADPEVDQQVHDTFGERFIEALDGLDEKFKLNEDVYNDLDNCLTVFGADKLVDHFRKWLDTDTLTRCITDFMKDNDIVEACNCEEDCDKQEEACDKVAEDVCPECGKKPCECKKEEACDKVEEKKVCPKCGKEPCVCEKKIEEGKGDTVHVVLSDSDDASMKPDVNVFEDKAKAEKFAKDINENPDVEGHATVETKVVESKEVKKEETLKEDAALVEEPKPEEKKVEVKVEVPADTKAEVKVEGEGTAEVKNETENKPAEEVPAEEPVDDEAPVIDEIPEIPADDSFEDQTVAPVEEDISELDAIVNEVADKLSLPFDQKDMLKSDLQNGRGVNWINEVTFFGDPDLTARFKKVAGIEDESKDEFESLHESFNYAKPEEVDDEETFTSSISEVVPDEE